MRGEYFSKVHQRIPEESTDYLGILNKTESVRISDTIIIASLPFS